MYPPVRRRNDSHGSGTDSQDNEGKHDYERDPRAKSLTNFHIMLYRVHPARVGFKLTTLVVIGTDCIGSCKSNYHMITTAL
jgi:hypothetical protein